MKEKPALLAFTFLELLVTLALTGILLALGQHIYGIFRQWVLKAEREAAATMSSALCRELLLSDLQQTNTWEAKDSTCLCLLSWDGEPWAYYQQGEDGLLRFRAGNSDTFPFAGSWQLTPTGILRVQDTRLQLTYVFNLPGP